MLSLESEEMVNLIKQEWMSQQIGSIFSASQVAGALRAETAQANPAHVTAANGTVSEEQNLGSDELNNQICNALSVKRRALLDKIQDDIVARFEDQHAQFDCFFFRNIWVFWEAQKSTIIYSPETIEPHIKAFKERYSRGSRAGMKPGPNYQHLLSSIKMTLSAHIALPAPCAGKVSPKVRIGALEALCGPCDDVEVPHGSCSMLLFPYSRIH